MRDPASKGSNRRLSARSIREFATRNAIILVLVALVLVIGIVRNGFLQPDNLVNILRISSVRLIIALGCAGALISGGTDLSAGRTVGLSAVIVASLVQRPDYASKIFPNLPTLWIGIPILAAIAAGMAIGLTNGIVIAFLRVPPFIATLGTMTIAWGAASLYVDRPPLGAQPIGGLRSEFTNLGTGDTLSLKANGSVEKIALHPDGTQTWMTMGHNVLILFPSDVPAGPSTTLYMGRVVFTVDTSGVFTLRSTSGKSMDICAALSN